MLPNNNPCDQPSDKSMILRDWLALDRTHLANERTLLAYVRSAITVFLVGISFIHLPYFHPDPEIHADLYTLFGWTLVVVAIVFLAVGVLRYFAFRRRLASAFARSTGNETS